jgi:hypothetical protein
MAQAKVCDIYGGTKGVQSYQVRIETWDDDPKHAPQEILKRTIDLGPRALERLKKFVERGTAKPEAADGK